VLKLRDIVQPNVKAAEDCRSPGRYRVCRDRTKLRQLFGLRQPSGALQWKSGRGLPQSKTLRVRGGAGNCASFLDCASPLALCNGKAAEDCRSPGRYRVCRDRTKLRQLLDCASHLALCSPRRQAGFRVIPENKKPLPVLPEGA